MVSKRVSLWVGVCVAIVAGVVVLVGNPLRGTITGSEGGALSTAPTLRNSEATLGDPQGQGNPHLTGRTRNDRSVDQDAAEAGPASTLLQELKAATANLRRLGVDPAVLSDEQITDEVRALVRTKSSDWQRLITRFVLSLGAGDLADLEEAEARQFTDWAFWISRWCGAYAPPASEREAARRALRLLREDHRAIEHWHALEPALVQLQRDLYRDLSLQEAVALARDPALSAREAAQILRGHAAAEFSSADLSTMLLRLAGGGYVIKGDALNVLVQRDALGPSTLSALDDALLERGREGRLYISRVDELVMPYLRATGRGGWEQASAWLGRAEADGQTALVAALLPHLDPRPPVTEVQRILGSLQGSDALSEDLTGQIRKSFGLE